MAYSLDVLESVVLETCYHCHGTGVEPNYVQGGSPPSGDNTCTVCQQDYVINGVSKLVTKEIWKVN